MTCRAFHRDLPDWVAGRLLPEDDVRMRLHRESCPGCAGAAAAERRLRDWLETLGPAPDTVDLWPRLEARLEAPPAPRWRLGGQRAFAMAGALAAGCLLAVLALMQPRPGPTVQTAAVAEPDSNAFAAQIIQVRSLPDPEEEPAWDQILESRRAARLALLGGVGR